MSYQEQGERINKMLGEAGLNEFDEPTREKLINAILRFGQVAKFRCRSNVAYDNFCNVVFKGLAKVERKQIEGFDFETLQYCGVCEVKE